MQISRRFAAPQADLPARGPFWPILRAADWQQALNLEQNTKLEAKKTDFKLFKQWWLLDFFHLTYKDFHWLHNDKTHKFKFSQICCKSQPVSHMIVKREGMGGSVGGGVKLVYDKTRMLIFSVTRRSRSDESHLLTYWLTDWTLALTLLMWPWWVMIPIEDLTDVILITLVTLMKDI